jgi:hypothetical protein
MPRPVEARISAMRAMRPPRRGLCSRTTWLACGGNATGLDHLPALGTASATAATNRIRTAGQLQVKPPHTAPRGAIMLWTGGSSGWGHEALSLGVVNGVHRCLTVDALGKPMADVPTLWILRNWSNLYWAGWTEWRGQALPPRFTRTIVPGASGPDVREVQRRLKVTPTTGYYGPLTKAAVVRFQKARPWLWPADGIIGPKSYAAILKRK